MDAKCALRRWSSFLTIMTVGLGTTMGILQPVQSEASEWSQWRGPERSGVVGAELFTGNTPRLEKIWSESVGIGCSSVSVANGRLYTVGHDDRAGVDKVFCFDAKDGKPLWVHQYPAELLATMYEGGPAATPTVDEGRVFIYSRQGRLLALDARSGDLLWQVDVVDTLGGEAPRWMYSCSPLVHGNLLIVDVGGRNASTVAFNKTNGAVVWKSGSEKAAYSSPIPMRVNGRTRIAMFNEYGLVILDPETGRQLARHRWETSYGVNAATPLILGDGRVLISSGYGKGSAMLKVEENRIQELWSTKALQSQFLSPIYRDGVIYGFDTGNNRLKALDASDGKVLWESRDFGRAGSVAMAGGTLVLLSEQGELALARADAKGIEKLTTVNALQPRSWVEPAVVGNRIYVRNNRGDLVCFEVR